MVHGELLGSGDTSSVDRGRARKQEGDFRYAPRIPEECSHPVNPVLIPAPHAMDCLGRLSMAGSRWRFASPLLDSHQAAKALNFRSEEHTSELQSPCNL